MFCCVGFLKQGFSVALLFLYPEAVRPSPACVHYVWARQRPVCAPGELVSTLPYCECVCVPVSMREPKFSTRLILHKSCLGNHCFCELTCAMAMMSRGHCFTKQLYFTHQITARSGLSYLFVNLFNVWFNENSSSKCLPLPSVSSSIAQHRTFRKHYCRLKKGGYIFFLNALLTCVCVCVCANAGACVCMRMWRPADKLSCSFPGAVYLFCVCM